MATCTCPVNLESMHQLCASCEADYLRYLDEIESTEPEEDETRPATLAEMRQLERWDFDQHTAAAIAISMACENSHNLTARVTALEANSETHRMALRAIAARLDTLAQAITQANAIQAKGQAA